MSENKNENKNNFGMGWIFFLMLIPLSGCHGPTLAEALYFHWSGHTVAQDSVKAP